MLLGFLYSSVLRHHGLAKVIGKSRNAFPTSQTFSSVILPLAAVHWSACDSNRRLMGQTLKGKK